MRKMASSASPFSFLPLSLPLFPFCFRLVDCQSLSHRMIVLVSVPFLIAQGAQNPNNHFLSLPFFGIDGRDWNWGGGKVGSTSIKRKPPSWTGFCFVFLSSPFRLVVSGGGKRVGGILIYWFILLFFLLHKKGAFAMIDGLLWLLLLETLVLYTCVLGPYIKNNNVGSYGESMKVPAL